MPKTITAKETTINEAAYDYAADTFEHFMTVINDGRNYEASDIKYLLKEMVNILRRKALEQRAQSLIN